MNPGIINLAFGGAGAYKNEGSGIRAPSQWFECFVSSTPENQDMPICGTKTVNMSTCQDVNMSICGTKTSKYLDFFAREAIRYVTLASSMLPQTPKINHFRNRIPKWPAVTIKWPDVTITYYLLYFSYVLEVPRPPKNRYFDNLKRL